jgi:hypothetical protein
MGQGRINDVDGIQHGFSGRAGRGEKSSVLRQVTVGRCFDQPRAGARDLECVVRAIIQQPLDLTHLRGRCSLRIVPNNAMTSRQVESAAHGNSADHRRHG